MAAIFKLSDGTTLGILDIYKSFRAELRRFFAGAGRDPHIIDDLVQELFFALLKTTPREELRDPRAYLFQVAWNVLNAWNRRARREPRYMMSLDAPETEGKLDKARGLWEKDDDGPILLSSTQLDTVLAKLPRTWQVAVVRHYRDGWTCQQIADELGCSHSAVKQYLAKALNEFRQHLNSRDVGR